MAPKPTSLERSGPGDRDVAGYRVMVRPRGVNDPSEYERVNAELAARLQAEVQQLQEGLSRAATSLGPAFVAEIRDVRSGDSVLVTVAVCTLYNAGADRTALADQFRQFAFTVQQTVAEWLAQRGMSADVSAFFDDAAFNIGRGDTVAATEPWERIAPVVAAIGTGIGVLGFVTFVGGAVQFARLEAAGLPAEDAVTVLPTANLIVVGTRALVPALLFAMAGVALLFIVRTLPLMKAAAAGSGQPGAPPRALTPTPSDDVPAQASQTDHADSGSANAEGGRPLGRAASLALILAGLETVSFGVTLEARGFWELAAFILLAVVTILLIACVAFRTPRFLWLGAALFIAMSVFLTGIEFARARQTSDVRAAVVIRQNKTAVIGFFVAETSGRVYLGRLTVNTRTHEVDRDKSRLFAFSKNQISDFAVGPPVKLDDALKQAKDLADELCSTEPAPEPVKTVAGSNARAQIAARCWSRPPGQSPSGG